MLSRHYEAAPLEAFVARILDAASVPYAREVVVEVEVEVRYWRLDFLLRSLGPDGADLVIEPGAAYWHDAVRDAQRYRVLATLGYPHVLILTDVEIVRTPEAAATRNRAFIAGPGQVLAPAPAEVAHDSHALVGGAVHAPAA